MKLFVAFAFLAAACSSGSALPGDLSSKEGTNAQGADTCQYPAGVDVSSNPKGAGCFAEPPRQICQVSNGATVLPDGGVTGGTESCSSICGASQYEMTCMNTPGPDAALGCQVIPIPTPSDALFYCCPCAE